MLAKDGEGRVADPAADEGIFGSSEFAMPQQPSTSKGSKSDKGKEAAKDKSSRWDDKKKVAKDESGFCLLVTIDIGTQNDVRCTKML